MKSTRQRILDYLVSHRVVTAADLGHALQVTAADVRHHLIFLIENGLVEVVGERHQRGRGRPSRLYSLSQQKLGDNLDILARALLEEILNTTPHKTQNDTLQHIAEKIQGDVETSGNLTRRLSQTIQHLNQLNYQARWEAHTEAPHLILGHCPYATIIEDHPELCQIDTCLLESLLKVPVKQKAKLARDTLGATYCMFKVGQK